MEYGNFRVQTGKALPSWRPAACARRAPSRGVEFVVIGAYAAATQGWSEPTGDIDITPNRTVRNLQRLAEALREMDAKVLTDDVPEYAPW